MGGQYPQGMHPKSFTLGVGSLNKAIGGYENPGHTAVFQINEIVHTARCTRSSVGQGFYNGCTFGGNLLAQV
jgi:hypothetical protein